MRVKKTSGLGPTEEMFYIENKAVKYYKLPEVSKILKANRNTLQSYIERLFIFPTIDSMSRGEPHLFSIEDVVSAGVFIKLKKIGFSSELAKKITYENSLDRCPRAIPRPG